MKKDDEMVMVIRTTDNYKFTFKCKSDKDTIYYAQQRHGKWPDWKTIDLEEFDTYTEQSLVQFDLSDGVPGFGIVQKRTVIGFGQVEQMAYVINRLWLNFLAYKGKFIISHDINKWHIFRA